LEVPEKDSLLEQPVDNDGMLIIFLPSPFQN
jgi:hypothetical protein